MLLADAGEAGTAALTELTLALEAPPQDLRLALHGPGVLRGRVVDRAGRAAGAIDLRLLLAEFDEPLGSIEAPRRSPRSVPTRGWVGSTSAAGTHLLLEWPLGETHLSERLPSGRHTLVARLPGGREARAEVKLVAGRTTRVTLRS